MAHISKEQTVQYILTLIDDTLQVQQDRPADFGRIGHDVHI